MLMHDALAKRVKETALLEGDFTLRSGKKSRFYFDKYLFETQADILETLGAEIARRIPTGVDRIAAPELGAVALGAAGCLASRLPFFIVRNAKKDYGTAKQVEGKILAGETVVLVEDIITSGGQVIEAAKLLRGMDVKIAKVIVALDRQEGGRENIEKEGLVVDAILTKADLGM